MDIRDLSDGGEGAVLAISHLLNREATVPATRRFLAQDRHHLLVAYERGTAAGFVTGVEMTHPDKGTEMFLYELGVDEPFRNQGIGKALVVAMADLARTSGCYGMWVLTDEDNAAAMHTYATAGGTDRQKQRCCRGPSPVHSLRLGIEHAAKSRWYRTVPRVHGWVAIGHGQAVRFRSWAFI